MISQLLFEIRDSIGCVSIRYSTGIKYVEYDGVNKKLTLNLYPNYVCDNKDAMRNFNVSCKPYVHVFYFVDFIQFIN